MIDIRTLRAAGLSDAQILNVIEEDQAKVRELNRIRKRNQRSRHADGRDGGDTSLSLVSKKETLSKERKGVRGKPIAIPLPDDWQPKGPQRDPTEADEFRDMCRSKGRAYVDFDAAYRQFQRSQYNARNKPGAAIATARPTMTEAEQRAFVETERLRILREASGDGKAEEAGLRRDTDVGDGRQRQSPQLRLAGGILHEDAERRGTERDALLAATTHALRR